MTTEKENPKPTWDENGHVGNTEYELSDNQFLRLSLTKDDNNKVYFAMMYVEKSNDSENEKELETVDLFYGFGDNGKPVNMHKILKEYWSMVEAYLKHTDKIELMTN